MTTVRLDHLTTVTVAYRYGDKSRLVLGKGLEKAENLHKGVTKRVPPAPVRV